MSLTGRIAIPITLALLGCTTTSTTPTPPPPAKTIVGIAVTGQPVKVFDHTTDKQEPSNLPDGQVTAWREADGTVNLTLPSSENYRMRGPELLHLTIDPHKIYSSLQLGSQTPEDLYNDNHWLMGPYSFDGKTFYSIAHSEWYACLLNGDCGVATPPQIIYDTTAHCYILIHTLFGGSNAEYYMTTKTLANPSWSDAAPIAGTAALVTDPAGPVQGMNDANFVSIIDPASGGYNFEFTGGSPMLFYSTFPSQYGGDNLARDLYRVPLTVTYR